MAKILIVEDEPAIRGMLRLQLEKAGHQIIEAADGIDGLMKARAESPDIIVLDVMIPKMDGWQVCREIKKTISIPIIMLTNRTQKIEEMRGWESGADEYIGKPWSPEQLLEITERLLRKAPPVEPS